MAEQAHTKKARAYLTKLGHKAGGHLSSEARSEVDEEIAKGVHEHEAHMHEDKPKTRLRLKDGGSCEGMAGGGRPDRASRGGKKGKTEINILVGKPGGDDGHPVPVPVPGGMPPHPPMAGPPPGMPPGMPPGGMPPGGPPHPPMAGPPGMPPGGAPGMPMRPPGMKKGGRAKKEDGRDHRYMGGGMPPGGGVTQTGPAMAGPAMGEGMRPGPGMERPPMMAKRGGRSRDH